MWLLGCLQEFPNKSLDSFKTNILSKFEKKWAKNVVTTVFSSQEHNLPCQGVDFRCSLVSYIYSVRISSPTTSQGVVYAVF